MMAIENFLRVLVRAVIICDLLTGLRQPCYAVPLPPDLAAKEPSRRELLQHFQPTLSDERISQVNDLLEQLHQHAIDKHFRLSKARERNRTKAAWDLESGSPTPASLSETDNANVTLDNDTDEKSPADSTFAKRYLFEGDILLTPEQVKGILEHMTQLPDVKEKTSSPLRRRQKHTAMINGDSSKWQSLPIRYDFDVSVDEDDKEPIRAALKYWESHTCIWFQHSPGATDGDYLVFFKGNGCYSMIGKVGGRQSVSVGDGCAQLGVVAHEVGHALGMWHEQSRPDSDRYIRLVTGNILDGTLSNFLQRSWAETNTYGVSYDLGSVMHYGPTAFAIDSTRSTIQTLLPGYQHVIGQRDRPSFLDVSVINKAYCDNRCSQSLSCRYGGYTHPTACNYCICPDGLAGTYCDRPADAQNANCGGIVEVNGEWTNISSPNYPKSYDKNQRCHWLLRAPSGSRVLFKFVDNFKLYCTATCYDYVEIKNDTDFTRTGMRFCCKDPPNDPFYSTTNEMVIIFNSVSSNELGFKGSATQYPQPLSNGGSAPLVAAITVASSVASTTVKSGHDTETPTATSISTQATTITTITAVASTASSATGSSTPFLYASSPTSRSGAWALWSDWSACSKTCGACGIKSRKRECLEGSCSGEVNQYKRCPFNICPGDTTCSKLTFLDFPCGGGGRVCSSVHEVTVKCTFPSCCAPFKPGKTECELAFTHAGFGSHSSHDHWDEWSHWGDCFGPPCGGCARQVRHRVCQDEQCRGEDREFRPCNTQPCSSCNDSSAKEIVEAPCTDPGGKNREMCRRPRKDSETTCPCCPTLNVKDGVCA